VFTLRSAGSYWICQNVLWSVISYSDWVTKSAWELWMWQLTRTNGSNGLGPASGQKSEEKKKKTKEKYNNNNWRWERKNEFKFVHLLYYYKYYLLVRLSNDTVYMYNILCIIFFVPTSGEYIILFTHTYIYISYSYLCVAYIRNYKYIIYNIPNVHIKI